MCRDDDAERRDEAFSGGIGKRGASRKFMVSLAVDGFSGEILGNLQRNQSRSLLVSLGAGMVSLVVKWFLWSAALVKRCRLKREFQFNGQAG